MEIRNAGKFITRTVPDTLDLCDSAALAQNALNGTIDPDFDYQLYFHVMFSCSIPYMNHYSSDVTLDAKYAESLPMMGLMTGKRAPLEDAQREAVLSRIEDGLYWNRYRDDMPWRSVYMQGFNKTDLKTDYSNILANARLIRAMLTWNEIDAKSEITDIAESLIGGLKRIAINRGDYSFYPDGGFGEPFNYPSTGWSSTNEAETDVDGGEGSVVGYQGNQIQVMAKWYELTGDKSALDLAHKLTNYVMLPRFWGGVACLGDHGGKYSPGISVWEDDPICVAGNEIGHWFSHFHMRCVGLRGILEYALAVNDWDRLQFVKRALEHAMTMAIPRLGWYNCYPGAANMMESCALGDLAAMFIRLSEAGVGDYWDDLDAMARNMMVEAQLKDRAQIESVARASDPFEHTKRMEYHRLAKHQYTEDDVIGRNLGAFVGQAMPNSAPKLWVMQCCTGNASQGLYYTWNAATRADAGNVTVNLLLNKVTKQVQVMSWLPYEGRAEFIIGEETHTLSVRVPGWVDGSTVQTCVNGNPADGMANGLYRIFTGLTQGDKVTLTFAVPETRKNYTANRGTPDEKTFDCVFRGSTAISVTPADAHPQSYRMYERGGMSGAAGMVDKTFYVADRTISNW